MFKTMLTLTLITVLTYRLVSWPLRRMRQARNARHLRRALRQALADGTVRGHYIIDEWSTPSRTFRMSELSTALKRIITGNQPA